MATRTHPSLVPAELDHGRFIAQLLEKLLSGSALSGYGNRCRLSRLKLNADFDRLKARPLTQKIAKRDGLRDSKRRAVIAIDLGDAAAQHSERPIDAVACITRRLRVGNGLARRSGHELVRLERIDVALHFEDGDGPLRFPPADS